MSRDFLGRWTRIFLVIAAVTIFGFVLNAQREVFAGTIAVTGTTCTPLLTFEPDPNVPFAFTLFHKLQIERTNRDQNILINCPLPSINGPNIASGDVTFAIVNGRSLDTIALCFVSYNSDIMSCGAQGSRFRGDYIVNAPPTKPPLATAPVVFIATRITTANNTVVVRSITGFWTDP